MSEFRIGDAAELLGVSTDTVRRWADEGRVATRRTSGNQRLVDGPDLARLASELSADPTERSIPLSARNRFDGLVTRVVADTVMAQVELQCGRNRVVALISAEAANELGLEPGVRASATIKATNVIIETGAP